MEKRYKSVEEILEGPTAMKDVDVRKIMNTSGEALGYLGPTANESEVASNFLRGLYHGTRGALLWNFDTAKRILISSLGMTPFQMENKDYLQEAVNNIDTNNRASSCGYFLGSAVAHPIFWGIGLGGYIAYKKLVGE